jgi:hypothetical protein
VRRPNGLANPRKATPTTGYRPGRHLSQGEAADLPKALGQRIGGRENLLGLFVQHQMVVAEMGTADVPMEVFGFHIERKGVGQNDVERFSEIGDSLRREVGLSGRSREFA